MITTHTLNNGLRLIMERQDTAGVYCGIAVDAGTRDELSTESGMAHFTEHMSFKGTHRRSALQIINRIEGVGGELNAYTGKEETVYYCSSEPRHLGRALELLFDIVFNSTYPADEMRREAEVVVDEIESYNDSPAELIFDEFEHIVFPTHSLGRNILGEADALRRHTTDGMAAFAHRLYRPERCTVFVVGPVDPSHVLRQVERIALPCESAAPVTRTAPTHYTPQQVERKRGVHQAHVMIGTRAVAVPHPDRMALVLLNNILGGPGLNSRLNLSLRERAGLVYTVESNYTGYTDTGVWSVYFGCDQKNVQRCRRLVLREIDRLIQSPISERTLAAAKKQMRGQLALGSDQHENMAIGMGKTMLHYNTYLTLPEVMERIEALTPSQLQDVATRILEPSRLSTLIYH